jgi:hypothetical protein
MIPQKLTLHIFMSSLDLSRGLTKHFHVYRQSIRSYLQIQSVRAGFAPTILLLPKGKVDNVRSIQGLGQGK